MKYLSYFSSQFKNAACFGPRKKKKLIPVQSDQLWPSLFARGILEKVRIFDFAFSLMHSSPILTDRAHVKSCCSQFSTERTHIRAQTTFLGKKSGV